MPELQDIARNSSFNWFQFGNGGIYYGFCCYTVGELMEIFQAIFLKNGKSALNRELKNFIR